ncbi:DUF6090 family protein [Eudoraea adriatica]|uniref:DUF6090 family protein n=1 Tax=Eudoraea adriatica TaxID=446681 RepID=UPI00035FCC8F|nr:DUF6090 family protein [Eudoraea adriatica]
MFKFFREIRKKLADENKPLKYLRYAIGEILLVVVGILIALQINNWNETQKARSEEKALLENLLEDLKSASLQSEGFIGKEQELIDNLILAMGIQPDGAPLSTAYFSDSIMIDMIWDFESNVPVINSYAEIKNTGKASLIRNREIRQKFTNLELKINNLNNLVKDRLTVQQIRIDNIAQDHLNLVRFTMDTSNNLDVNIQGEPVNNYPEILKRPTVRNLLAMKLLLTDDVLKFRMELQNEIDLIIELIDKELGAF